jgi:hypothetical protein
LSGYTVAVANKAGFYRPFLIAAAGGHLAPTHIYIVAKRRN